MTIPLSDVLRIDQSQAYKLHFARWNGADQPLEVFVRSRREWQGWQEFRPARNEFNRPYIFALMDFYHERSVWLFGGIFEVRGRHRDHYEVELMEQGRAFIGRLKLRSSYKERATRVNFENHYPMLEISEILPAPYSGRAFPGFENIDLRFDELEAVVRTDRPDWKAALESVKGIYLITDSKTGKLYVGSAYGEGGVWSRWREYVDTGHGKNIELRRLAVDAGLDYYRANFRFALLEHRPVRTDDALILTRENFWKRILLSRGDWGHNRN